MPWMASMMPMVADRRVTIGIARIPTSIISAKTGAGRTGCPLRGPIRSQ